MKLRRPTPVMYAAAIFVGLVIWRTQQDSSPSTGGRRYKVVVQSVIDGDTFETGTGVRVRLLGIDSPELGRAGRPNEHFAVESTDWLKAETEGKVVEVEEGIAPLDRYGRTLGWIRTVDGTLINEEALRTGHARLLDRFGLPIHLEPALRAAESAAKKELRGLWNTSPSQNNQD